MKIYLGVLWIFILLIIGCKSKEGKESQPNVEISKMNYIDISLDLNSANQLKIVKSKDSYHLESLDDDPYIFTEPLNQKIKDNKVLTFEYKLSENIDNIQVFFAAPISEKHSIKSNTIKKASSWTKFSIDLGGHIEEFSWGDINDFLRLDFGNQGGIEMDIRKIHLRERNEEERKIALEKKEFKENDQKHNETILNYLSEDFSSKITKVEVRKEYIEIQGESKEVNARLFEITPYEDVTNLKDSQAVATVGQGSFNIRMERFVEKGGVQYDRLLSKWAIGTDSKEVNGLKGLYSHAHFPDEIEAKYILPEGILRNKKGLGGLRNNSLMIKDLDSLDIGSVTINVPITSYVYLNDRANTYSHKYGGKTYYFDKQKVDNLDKLLLEAYKRDIIVSAIILIQKAADCADPKVGELMQDKHFTGDAFFTMPRLDNPESINCYAAMIDFLASRYCKPGSPHGRIYKWIMHNEVDAGTTWTNMGNDRPMYVYLSSYYRSMRICYTIAREYDVNAEVLASFTHSWKQPVPEGDYAVYKMLEGLRKWSEREGDFQWGLAYHSYPQDLTNPETWNDSKATFSMNSSLVTFKNIEVIDVWIKKPENKYHLTKKRTLWLSENGTNTRSYSTQDLLEQAAGFAYAWKKIEQLDGIDAIQWHNWMDNRFEFGLRIGLRRFSDDADDPGGEKPVWYAFQAAGTGNEDEVFEPYKAIIGIDNWKEIFKSVQ